MLDFQTMQSHDMQEASVALKAAKNLRIFAATNDSKVEQELIAQLSSNPSIWRKLFPNEGHSIQRDIIRQKLKQLVEHQTALTERHFAMYCDSLDIIAKVAKRTLESKGHEFLLNEFIKAKERTIELISTQAPAEMRRFKMLTQNAKEIFGDDPDMLEVQMQSINRQMAASLEATERAFNNLMKLLIPADSL